jgi:hypothetical protein
LALENICGVGDGDMCRDHSEIVEFWALAPIADLICGSLACVRNLAYIQVPFSEMIQKAKVSSLRTSVATNMEIDEKNVTRLNEPIVEEPGDSGVIQLKPQKKWTSYLWDTFDKSPKERRFLFKVDAAILTFASLGMSFANSLVTGRFKN